MTPIADVARTLAATTPAKETGLAAIDPTVLAQRALAIALLLGLALLTRLVMHKMVSRGFRRMAEGKGLLGSTRAIRAISETGGYALERREQRMNTLSSVIKSIISVIILFSTMFMCFDVVGLNLTPLIASASVATAAFGFGAQNLVKDFLAGISFALEDQLGVGDRVDMGNGLTGSVEAVRLRITRIRDNEGTVWYVRNGEIMRLGNFSQGWSTAVLDTVVAYDADLHVVRAALGNAAAKVRQEPGTSSHVLGNPDVLGVQKVEPGMVTVRMTVRTTASGKDVVLRALRERVREELIAAEVPTPEK